MRRVHPVWWLNAVIWTMAALLRAHRGLRAVELEPVELELHRQRRRGHLALELEPLELVHVTAPGGA